jgi:hypothetical protein
VTNGVVEKNKNSLNLKFKPYSISWTVKLARISFKLLNYIVSCYSGTVEHRSSYSDARGVTNAFVATCESRGSKHDDVDDGAGMNRYLFCTICLW